MAQHILAWAYGTPATYDAKNGGWQIAGVFNPGIEKSFPVQGTVFDDVSPAVTVGTVSCNSIITVLPTGLSRNGKAVRYFSDATITTLNTAANA